MSAMQPVAAEAPASAVLVNPLTVQDVDVAVAELVSGAIENAIARIESEAERIVRHREVRFAVLNATNVRDEIDQMVKKAEASPMDAILAKMYIEGVRDDLVGNFKVVNPKAPQAAIEETVDGYLSTQLAKIPGQEAAPAVSPVKKARGKG